MLILILGVHCVWNWLLIVRIRIEIEREEVVVRLRHVIDIRVENTAQLNTLLHTTWRRLRGIREEDAYWIVFRLNLLLPFYFGYRLAHLISLVETHLM